MILADTSVWVDHFRRGDLHLGELLRKMAVGIHPLIVGELACGNLPRREETLSLLERLPVVPPVSADEVFHLIESRHLWGKEIGWIDASLLASCILSGCQLWTLDRCLHAVAVKLKAGYSPPRN